MELKGENVGELHFGENKRIETKEELRRAQKNQQTEVNIVKGDDKKHKVCLL